MDTDAGSERFGSYEAELKLVQADLNQKLDQIPELSGEPRKAAISQAERALEEADEILGSMRLEKSHSTKPQSQGQPALPELRERCRCGEAQAEEPAERQVGTVRQALHR